MNGPHFGDRFGIVSELLNAFEKNGVDLLCLGCTIASITCVVQALYLDPAIRVIKKCFEVPCRNCGVAYSRHILSPPFYPKG